MQLGEIDALAVEAEAPAEGRDQEADRDDAPAVVAERGFVDRDVAGGVHGFPCFLRHQLRNSENFADAEISRCTSVDVRSNPALDLSTRSNCRIVAHFADTLRCSAREIRRSLQPAARGAWRTTPTPARRARAAPAENHHVHRGPAVIRQQLAGGERADRHHAEHQEIVECLHLVASPAAGASPAPARRRR